MSTGFSKPPKLKTPSSDTTAWLYIMLPTACVISFFVWASSVTKLQTPMQAEEAGSDTTELAPSDLAHASAAYLSSENAIEMNNDGKLLLQTVHLKTAFDKRWKVRIDQREAVLFGPPITKTTCQALVIPIRDYMEMMSGVDGDHATLMNSLLAIQSEATRTLSGTNTLTEAKTLRKIERPRKKTLVMGRTYTPEYVEVSTQYAVYVEGDTHAATLFCSALKTGLNEGKVLELLLNFDFTK